MSAVGAKIEAQKAPKGVGCGERVFALPRKKMDFASQMATFVHSGRYLLQFGCKFYT